MTDAAQLTLSDFLLARIAEDEAAALQALKDDGDWNYTYAAMNLWPSHVVHLTRHSPSNVLAECKAKRRIVAWCSERTMINIGRMGSDPTAPANYVPGEYAHKTDAPVLRMLAAAYADHPDYRPEWSA